MRRKPKLNTSKGAAAMMRSLEYAYGTGYSNGIHDEKQNPFQKGSKQWEEYERAWLHGQQVRRAHLP